VVGDGRAYQAHATDVLGNLGEDLVRLDLAHATVGRPAHHAVGAGSAAAARRLDEKHVRQLGVRRDDLGIGGQAARVRGKDGGRPFALQRRNEEARQPIERRQQGFLVGTVAK